VSYSAGETDPRGSPSTNGGRRPHDREPLRLIHHHPGYLRIRAETFIQPSDGGKALAAAKDPAETASGFHSWSPNAKTGSVVIEYEPGALDADDLLKHIVKQAGFAGVEHPAGKKMTREERVSGFLDRVQEVNQIVSQLTGERADLRELVPVALAATSVVSFVLNEDRGRLPSWDSALYHSYRIFMQWHRPEVRTRERAARRSHV
jgi:hypothetical protein